MISYNDLEKENIMLWPTTPKPQVNKVVVVVVLLCDVWKMDKPTI
jgi:hypothetical protein